MLQAAQNLSRTAESELHLWFSTEPAVTLERTLFHTSLLDEPVLAVRGKSCGAFPQASTFQWYLGPQALMIFLLRGITARSKLFPVLEGGAGSLAACLDMILEKTSSWLSDLFGCRADGSQIIRRIARRTNAGRRRGGLVSFSLNDKFLSTQNIHVILDGRRVTDRAELVTLANAIEFQWMSNKATRKALQLPSGPDKGSYRASRKGGKIGKLSAKNPR